MASLSHRADRILSQPMFDLMVAANLMQAQGRRVIRLEIGDTSANADPHLLETLNAIVFGPDNLGYSPSLGEERLRRAFAKVHNELKGTRVGPEHVVVTPANASITQIFTILADPGDAVLMLDPSFPTYRLAARFTELEIIEVPLTPGAGFAFDFQAIEEQLSVNPNARIFIVDSPSNPLGIAHEAESLVELGALCLRYGVTLIIDETYRSLVFDGSNALKQDVEGALFLYSLSKDAGVPGIRLGSVIGSQTVVEKIGQYNSLFYSCLPKALQFAAAAYLEGPANSHAESARLYESRIRRVSEILAASPALTLATPNSSIYCYVDVRATQLDGASFAARLLEEEGVCVCPGEGFGTSGRDYIRLTVLADIEELEEGLEKMVRFAEKHLVAM